MSRQIRKPAVVGVLAFLFLGLVALPSPSAEQPTGVPAKPDPATARLEKLLSDLEQRLETKFDNRLKQQLGQLESRLRQTVPPAPGMRAGAGKVPTPGPKIMPRAGQRAGRGRGWQPRDKRTYGHALKRFARSRKFAATPSVRAANLPAAFDLRQTLPANVSLHVRNQLTCGSCWDFAAVAAYEANFAKQFGKEAYGSEQYVLNGCASLGEGNCDGGNVDSGVRFLAQFGTTARPYPNDDYQAVEGPFTQATPAYSVTSWGPVSADDPNAPVTNPTMLKQIIYQYGVVAVGINASDGFEQFGDQNHQGTEVWTQDDGPPDETHGHVVAIIGWSDTITWPGKKQGEGAWLVKNSWGSTWGHTAGFGSEGGYMWVKYGVNVIGQEAVWIQAAAWTNGPPPNIPPPTPPPVTPPCSNKTETDRRLGEWQNIEGGKYLPK